MAFPNFSGIVGTAQEQKIPFFRRQPTNLTTPNVGAVRLKELVVDGIDVFAVAGEIDFHFAPVLRTMFQAKLNARCPALILDFKAVEFIDSRGIATVLEYLRDCAAHGGSVCLAALSPDVAPIIDTVRLQTVMPIFATVSEAAASLKAQLAAGGSA